MIFIELEKLIGGNNNKKILFAVTEKISFIEINENMTDVLKKNITIFRVTESIEEIIYKLEQTNIKVI